MGMTADQLIDDLKRAKKAGGDRTLRYEGYVDGEIVLHCAMTTPELTWKEFQAAVETFLVNVDQFADVIERQTAIDQYKVYMDDATIEVFSGKAGVEVSASLTWESGEEHYQDILDEIIAEAPRFKFPKPRPL
jgi:hypothetical protein